MTHDAIVIGGPSVIAAWLFELVRTAAGMASPPAAVHHVDHNTPPIADQGTAAPHRAPCLVLAQYPNGWLLRTIALGKIPVLWVVDDPIDAVAYAIRAGESGSLVQAIRAQSAAAVPGLVVRGNAAVRFASRRSDLLARELIAHVLHHLGLHLDAAAAEQLAERFAGPSASQLGIEAALAANVTAYAPPSRAANGMAKGEGALAATALDPILRMAFGGELSAFTWPVEMFFQGDSLELPAPRVVDLTARRAPSSGGRSSTCRRLATT